MWRIARRPDFEAWAHCVGYSGTTVPIGTGEWHVPHDLDQTVLLKRKGANVEQEATAAAAAGKAMVAAGSSSTPYISQSEAGPVNYIPGTGLLLTQYDFTMADHAKADELIKRACKDQTFDFNHVIVITSEKNPHLVGEYIDMGQVYNDSPIFCRVNAKNQIDQYLFRPHVTETFPEAKWKIGKTPDFKAWATCSYSGADVPIGKGTWVVPYAGKEDFTVVLKRK